MNALANNSPDDSLYETDAFGDALEEAISDAKTIAAMEGEYSTIEYRKMFELEANDDAIAFCDYRKQCRRSLLRSWFTTAEEISDYVSENNPPTRSNSVLFGIIAPIAETLAKIYAPISPNQDDVRRTDAPMVSHKDKE